MPVKFCNSAYGMSIMANVRFDVFAAGRDVNQEKRSETDDENPFSSKFGECFFSVLSPKSSCNVLVRFSNFSPKKVFVKISLNGKDFRIFQIRSFCWLVLQNLSIRPLKRSIKIKTKNLNKFLNNLLRSLQKLH